MGKSLELQYDLAKYEEKFKQKNHKKIESSAPHVNNVSDENILTFAGTILVAKSGKITLDVLHV